MGVSDEMRATRSLRRLGVALDAGQNDARAFAQAIPMLIGTSMGEVGVFFAAGGVAAYELYENWDKVRVAFGDVGPLRDAMTTIEGLTKRVKDLNAEIASGKAQEGTVTIKRVVEAMADERTKAVKAAEDMADAKPTEEEKATRDRFEDVIREHGGSKKLSEKLGDEAFQGMMKDNGGPFAFLSGDDSTLYADLKKKQGEAKAKGIDLPYLEEGIKSLEEKARQAAAQDAFEAIGRARDSAADRKNFIGDLAKNPAHKDLSDILSGKGFTDKEWQEANEWSGKFMEAEDKADEKAVKDKAAWKKKSKRRDEADLRRGEAQNADEERLKAQEHKEDMKDAKEKMPGLGDMIQDDIMQSMIGGRSASAVRNDIRAALEKRGFSDDQMDAMVPELFTDANKDVGQKITRQALKGSTASHSEVYDAASMSNKVQSGVTDDTGGTRDFQKRAIDYLAKIAEANGNTLRLQVD
jgi:hypothetical protein